MASAVRLCAALCIIISIAGPATAVIVQHVSVGTDHHVSTWHGAYTYSSDWGQIQKWPGLNTDASLGEFSRSEIQAAIDSTKSTYGGWDAKIIVSQVDWDGSPAIPADLDPIAGSIDIDQDTMAWGQSTYYVADKPGGGNWKQGGSTYSNFIKVVNAGVATSDSMVVDNPPWQAVWNTTTHPTVNFWDIVIDVPESLVQHFLHSPSSDGFCVSAKNGPVSIFTGDQWDQQANIRVEITQPPQTGPWLALSNESMDLLMNKTSPVAAPQSITVTNAGTGTIAWTAAESPAVAWISLTNASGVAGDAFEVTVDVSSLAVGDYSAKVLVSDGAAVNSPAEVWVNVTVFESSVPTIELAPTSVTADASSLDPAIAPLPVTVNNVAFGSLNWTAQVQGTVSWLSLTNASGSDGDTLQVVIDKSALWGGTYTANIEVHDPAASNSPAILPVTLMLHDQDANIDKALSYDDAWEDGAGGWVEAQRAIYAAKTGGTDGMVVHLGDSISYANQYGQFARNGEGKTPDDVAICTWMNSSDWPGGGNYTSNGWYLTAYGVSTSRSYTAKNGITTGQYISGGAELPSINQMFTTGYTNPDGKQYRDALIAVMMLGTNDASGSRATSEVIANLTTLIDKLQAAKVIVCLSTIPPKLGDQWLVLPYNEAIRDLAQTRKLPLIDFYEEILRRRPGETWRDTLMSGDGVHPSGTGGGYTSASNPYANDGAALSEVGYLLRGWLSVQKVNEIKAKVIDGPAPTLLSSDPANDGTLCRSVGNYITLTFDDDVTVTGRPSIAPTGGSGDLAASFTITFSGATVTAQENGAVLANQTWYTVTHGTLNTQPFSIDLCTLIGDVKGDGQVLASDLGVVWSHNSEMGQYLRADVNGDGQVLASDLGIVWSHNSEMGPPKP